MTPEERAALRALADRWRDLADGAACMPSERRERMAAEACDDFTAALTPRGAVDLLDALAAAEARAKAAEAERSEATLAMLDACRTGIGHMQERDAALARERALRERVTAIAGDFVTDSDEYAPLALSEMREALEAALSAAPPLPVPASPWRHIATAPGQEDVLVCNTAMRGWHCIAMRLIGEWRTASRHGGDPLPYAPTHWMPLPEPPAAQAGEPGA